MGRLLSSGQRTRPYLDYIDAIAAELRVPCEAFCPETEPRWTFRDRYSPKRFEDLQPEVFVSKECFIVHKSLPCSLIPDEVYSTPQFADWLRNEGWHADDVKRYIASKLSKVRSTVIPASCRKWILANFAFIRALPTTCLEPLLKHLRSVLRHPRIHLGFLTDESFDEITRDISGTLKTGPFRRLTLFDDICFAVRLNSGCYAYSYHGLSARNLLSKLREHAYHYPSRYEYPRVADRNPEFTTSTSLSIDRIANFIGDRPRQRTRKKRSPGL